MKNKLGQAQKEINEKDEVINTRLSKPEAQKAIQESFTYANDKIASNLEIVMKGVASSMTDLNNAVKDLNKRTQVAAANESC